MKQIALVLFTLFSVSVFAQEKIDYLSAGNDLLNQNKPKEAEKIFKNGLKKEPNNLILKNQIALAQMDQKENKKAQKTLDEILKNDSLNVASLWYSGINNYSRETPNFIEAIKHFEKAYPLIGKSSKQYYAVNYYIGNAYRNLLFSEGLSYQEVDRMLETLNIYTDLQPNAPDYASTKQLIEKIETNRPPKNVKKWVISNGQNATKIIKKSLKE
ncbi:hypothetical protein D3C87_441030 [compost metagenome]